jgi:1,4-alpha-glucan branching enzyme
MRLPSVLGFLLILAAAAPAAAAPAPSTRPGMGATSYGAGTTFRVWAPHADRVFVEGDWNGWTAPQDELAREPGGTFSGDVDGALPGQAYRYAIVYQGQTLLRDDPRARQVRGADGPSVIVDPAVFAGGDGFQPGAKRQHVIYELHVASFNATAGAQPGTFASARDRLDSLADLGVDMIELMPPCEFPGSTSWGYNPSLPFAVATPYGTPQDFRDLVGAAHARGIGVVVDVVHNHWTGTKNPMVDFDGPSFGALGIYFYTDARGKTPWGPRPDYGRPEVRAYIVDNARMWLEDYGCDGLRWDSTVNIRESDGNANPEGWALLVAANGMAHGLSPAKLEIAEDLQGDAAITRASASGGAGFDSQWDPAFYAPIVEQVLKPRDADRSMAAVRGAIVAGGDRASARIVCTEDHDIVADNHGKARLPEMIAPGDAASYPARKRSTLAAAIMLTAPGIPMLFEGQEFLQDGAFSFAHTTGIDWSRASTFAGIRDMYKEMIRLRRDLDGTTRGLTGDHVNVFHVNERAKVIAFHRWDRGGAGDDVVVLANFSGRAFPSYEIGLPADGIWKVRFDSDSTRYGADFGAVAVSDVTAQAARRDGLAFSGTLAIGPYSVVILSR